MDNTRTLPLQQNGGNALTRNLMKSNLRPVVLFIAFLTGLWSFLWAVSSFRLVTQDSVDEISGLKTAALIMGILYSVATVIQAFGLTAVSMRKLNLVRIYAFGSILTALCILAGSLTQIIIHYSKKTSLINVCTNDNTGDTIFYNWGIWGPVTSTTLDAADAASWCNRAWNRGAWSDILSFLIEIVLAALFLFIIFGYYKQLLDPSSVANAVRTPNQYPLGAYPQQPYAGGYEYNPNFPPPPGPPPGIYGQGFDQPFVPPYDNTKLPAYDGNGTKYGDTKDGDDMLKNGGVNPFEDRNDAGRSDSGHGNSRR